MNCVNEKEKLAHALAQLAQSIMFREPPFHKFQWRPEVSWNLLLEFHRYKDEVDPLLREQFSQFICTSSKVQFLQQLGIPGYQAFSKVCPDLYAAYQEMIKYTEMRNPLPRPYIAGCEIPQLKVNDLIATTMKEMGYRSIRNAPVKGMKSYCKDFDTNSLLVGFERGSLRTFMSLYVGVLDPEFMLDIGNFFGIPQSRFDYVHETLEIKVIDGEERRVFKKLVPSQQDVIDTVRCAIDIAEWLFPYIFQAVKSIRSQT